MSRWKLIIAFLFLISFSKGQELPDITTDRPDQSESSSTVPHKTFQIESGFVFSGDQQKEQSIRNLDFFNTLFRYGVFDNFELRLSLNVADVKITPEGGGQDTTLSGLAPLAVGTKIFITEQKGVIPELSFLGTITIPHTGSQDFKILKMASDIRFAAGWRLSDRISAGGNIGGQWNTIVPGGSGFYSAVIGMALLQPLSMFVEIYGWLPEKQLPDHRVDAGFTFPVRKNLQFDISGGLGLSEISPDYFINAGIAWRIPR